MSEIDQEKIAYLPDGGTVYIVETIEYTSREEAGLSEGYLIKEVYEETDSGGQYLGSDILFVKKIHFTWPIQQTKQEIADMIQEKKALKYAIDNLILEKTNYEKAVERAKQDLIEYHKKRIEGIK